MDSFLNWILLGLIVSVIFGGGLVMLAYVIKKRHQTGLALPVQDESLKINSSENQASSNVSKDQGPVA